MSAEHQQLAEIYGRVRKLAQAHGTLAIQPLPCDSPLGYQKRALIPFKEFSPQWKSADLDKAGPALAVALADIERDAMRAIDTLPGLRKVEVADPYSGARCIEWHGDDDGAVWHAFANPLRIGNFATVKPAAKEWYRE